MKRIGLILFLLSLLFLPLSAADMEEIPLQPQDTEISALGGAYITNSRGYRALYTNPAGLGRPGPYRDQTITYFNANPWIYSQLNDAVPLGVGLLSSNLSAAQSALNRQLTSGGFGYGSSIGGGYVGQNIGLGGLMVSDSYFFGSDLGQVTGDIYTTLSFVGGMSFEKEWLGGVFYLGGVVRPMVRMHSPVSQQGVTNMRSAIAAGDDWTEAFNPEVSYYGFGLGIDFGIIAEFKPFSLGVVLKDIADTRFYYTQSSYEKDYGALASFRLPPSGPVTAYGRIPMNLGVGFSFTPDLGKLSHYFAPSLMVDFQDILGVLQHNQSLLNMLHLGAELELLSFAKLRVGLNQGHLTYGLGLHLFIVDFGFAYFSRELGNNPGEKTSSGLSFEFALQY